MLSFFSADLVNTTYNAKYITSVIGGIDLKNRSKMLTEKKKEAEASQGVKRNSAYYK